MSNAVLKPEEETLNSSLKELEHQIEYKDYNSAMLKARQILEYLVKIQLKQAKLSSEGELINLIDLLHNKKFIDDTSCNHYHKIREIGNKAAHENSTEQYDAIQAQQFLILEIKKYLANPLSQIPIPPAPKKNFFSNTEKKKRKKFRKKRKNKNSISGNIFKIIVPLLLIAGLAYMIFLIRQDSEDHSESLEDIQMPAIFSETMTSQPETPTETVTYMTTTDVNIRTEPSTSSAIIIALDADTPIEFISVYDDSWSIILYEGEEAYVASQYITKQ